MQQRKSISKRLGDVYTVIPLPADYLSDGKRQGFNSHPKFLHPIRSSKDYICLLEDLVYIDTDGKRHIVHAPFMTDGASIPRFFWRVVGHPFSTDYLVGAIVHDYYCQYAEKLHQSGLTFEASQVRERGDKLFKEILLFLRLPSWKVTAMYSAVRSVGKAKYG